MTVNLVEISRNESKSSGRSVEAEILFKATATVLKRDLRCGGEAPLKTSLGETAFRRVFGNPSEIIMRIKAAYDSTMSVFKVFFVGCRRLHWDFEGVPLPRYVSVTALNVPATIGLSANPRATTVDPQSCESGCVSVVESLPE